MSLKTVRLKPNPPGRDLPPFQQPSPAQLGAEWADIQNVTQSAINVANYGLYHRAYKADGTVEWAPVMTASWSGWLQSGGTVRVHSGLVRPLSVLRSEDLTGADYHAFTGRDRFIWNNYRDDSAGIWLPSLEQWADLASYKAPVPNGMILVRNGDRLLPFASSLFALTR